MSGLDVLHQVRPVLGVVQDGLAAATFDLGVLNSTHQSSLDPDSTFFREMIGKVLPDPRCWKRRYW